MKTSDEGGLSTPWAEKQGVDTSPSSVLSLFVVAVLLGGLAVIVLWLAKPVPSLAPDLPDVLAETDRLDPDWRAESIEAGRLPLADRDNSAVCVQEVCDCLPPDWPAAELARLKAEPPHLLSEEASELLQRVLAQVKTAREEARRLAHLPHGDFPLARKSSPFPSLGPCACVRRCAHLLEWQAWLQAQQEDADGALLSLRCLLHAGAAINDEPTVLAQVIRLSLQQRACATLQYILAQTEPKDAALHAVEQALRREQEYPLLLWIVRGERLRLLLEPPRPHQEQDRLRVLQACNRLTAVVRLPAPAQQPLLQAIWKGPGELPRAVRRRAPSLPSLSRRWLGQQALLSCARTALAVERYRLRHQHWPASLDDLVPNLLPALPRDPFDDAPLRYRQDTQGVIITSPRSEARFRLWGPRQRRRKPAPAAASENVFGSDRPAKDRQSCFQPSPRGQSS